MPIASVSPHDELKARDAAPTQTAGAGSLGNVVGHKLSEAHGANCRSTSSERNRSAEKLVSCDKVPEDRIEFEYAARRRVLSFKYRTIAARRGHHTNDADSNWFLAL